MFYVNATKALTLLNTLGVKAPADTLKAHANVSRIAALSAPAADTSAAAAQILKGEDPTEALAQASGAALFDQARTQARKLAERQVVATMQANADTIMQKVRAEVYTPAIKALTDAAELIKPGTDAQALVEQKRLPQLQALMNADTAAEQLKTVMHLRENLYPNPAGRTAGRTFRTAAAFANEKNAFDVVHGFVPESADEWLKVIQAGSTPWLPTLTEYEALDAQHKAQPNAAQARDSERAKQQREHREAEAKALRDNDSDAA